MDLSWYIYAVALAAIIYAFLAREIQNRLINKKEMDEIQKESKRLNEEYKAAAKNSDKAKMERIMAEQMALLPKMNKMIFSQFKPMIVVLIIFAGFIFVVNYFDPSVKDDIIIPMSDSGGICDATAGDGIYTGCYQLSGENYGKWFVHVKAFNNGAQIGHNATAFYYSKSGSDYFVDRSNVNMVVATDKQLYQKGETIIVTAKAPQNTNNVTAEFSNGTEFSVELPLTIPLLDVKTIYQPYWWFILISLIFGLAYSFITGKIKMPKGNAPGQEVKP